MKFSINALKEFVDISSIDVKTLVDRLTFSSFEVEEVTTMAEASNLVIGKIISCENHPKSDHLHLLKVDCGQKYGVRDIVCGAKNAREGIKVIVALPGAKLPRIGVEIKESTILGYPSFGMCCSLVELGVLKEMLTEEEINGIEEVNESIEVGREDVLEALHLDDVIIDVNVLPNRIDCLSYLSFAREIAALFNVSMKPLEKVKLDTIEHSSRKVTSVTDSCKKISLLYIEGIKTVSKTPDHVKDILKVAGIRCISPIVDLGNYIMLLTGEPINMYDLDKVEGDVKVTSSYSGNFKAFDEKEYKLIEDDILIEDEKKPLCLAGIMASDTAMITSSTKSIAIEFASFYHANIRHTAKRLGLSSYSQQLFAKGVNISIIDDIISYSLSLLDEFFVSYEKISIANYQKEKVTPTVITYSLAKTNKRLGSNYTAIELEDILKRYQIEYDKKGDGTYYLYPPKYRPDLKEQCDIDEELFRYYSIDRIPLNLDAFPVTKGEMSIEKIEENKIRNLLVSKGLYEIVSYTLIDEKKDNSIRIFSFDENYKVINPMTKDHEIVRADLLPSMLEVIEYNLNHSNKDFSLFEISPMCIKKDESNPTYLSIALVGNKVSRDNFNLRPYDFFDIKGLLIAILNKLGINANRYMLSNSTSACFNPYCSADLYLGNIKAGSLGKIHPSLSDENIFLLEINLSLLTSMKGRDVKYKPLSSSPLIRRDLSFLIDDKVTFSNIKNVIMKQKDQYLKDVLFFDEFTSNDKKKYLGISLYMSKDDGTLSDAEINNTFNKAIDAVIKSLGLSLRK